MTILVFRFYACPRQCLGISESIVSEISMIFSVDLDQRVRSKRGNTKQKQKNEKENEVKREVQWQLR